MEDRGTKEWACLTLKRWMEVEKFKNTGYTGRMREGRERDTEQRLGWDYLLPSSRTRDHGKEIGGGGEVGRFELYERTNTERST